MNLLELKDAFRIRADDNTGPKLWSDEEIILYLNEAEQESAERALLIQDETTPAVCQIPLLTTTGVYPLHESVLAIMRAKPELSDKLVITSRETMDRGWPGWETATGTPQYLFENGDGNITIVPIPVVADTLKLAVKRLPLTKMAADIDTPEIPARYHYRMLDWALRCAYLKQDAEVFDKQAAASYEVAFERSFGYRHDSNVQRKQRDKSPRVTQSNW